MKKISYIAFLIVFIFMISNLSVAQASDYTITSANQCSSPTMTLNIKGESPDQYNVTAFSVTQGTCLAVAFENADTIDHSFTIDAGSGYSFFTIYLKPGKTATVNFQAPSTNVKIKYYCGLPGHEANGMYGFLNVQNNTIASTGPSQQTITTSPSFEVVSVFLAFPSTIILFSKFKRMKK